MSATTARRGLLASLAAGLALGLASSACAGLTPVSSAAGEAQSRFEVELQSEWSGRVVRTPGLGASDPPPPGAYRFVSSPDFMNADIADLSALRRYNARTRNSWNSSYERAVDTVMSGFAAESPDDVLVAGDLVNGHWGLDVERSGVFGPVRTARERRAAVRRAASTYYTAWRELFDDRDLDVRPAVGDHEIGDNAWSGPRRGRFKRRNLELFKDEFADAALRPWRYDERPPGPARRTAYATYLDPDVLLVSVNVFSRTRDDVIVKLDRQQLRWLNRVLARASRVGTEWIVVQGHTPVLTPVRTTSSSALRYRGGARSAFWRTMVRHGVDLYLSGEVHDITARTRDGLTQISHGGLLGHPARSGRGGTNYLLGTVIGDRMELTSKRWRVADARRGRRLWQTTRQNRPPIAKTFGELREVGTMVLGPDGVESSSGRLGPYRPGNRESR